MDHFRQFKGKTLTEEGYKWAIACLDPFHDNQLQLEGYPDIRSTPSIVQMHRQEYTLRCPAGVVGNWDASVTYTGFDSTSQILPATTSVASCRTWWLDQDYDHAVPSAHASTSAIVVHAAATGANLDLGTSTAYVTGLHTHLNSTSERGRTIALAIEVHNTTAAVYKQGAVTTACLQESYPDSNMARYVDTNAAPYPDYFAQSTCGPYFPATLDEVKRIPTARTWDAADGVYAIPRLILDPPITCPALTHRAHGFTTITGSYCTYPSAFDAVTNIPDVIGLPQGGFTPMMMFFSGLSNESSLQITVRTAVEYFPAAFSPLIGLCTPSPSFDYKALCLYSEIVKTAPYAVRVTENNAGDYFARILQIAGKIGGVVSPYFGEFAPLVAGGAGLVGAAGNGLEQWFAQRKKNGNKVPEAGAAAMPTYTASSVSPATVPAPPKRKILANRRKPVKVGKVKKTA